MENNTIPATAKEQHVTKASSDQLLNKFSEVGCESDDKSSAKKELQLAKRRKRLQVTKGGGYKNGGDESKSVTGVLVERNALLPPSNPRSSGALIRRLGISRAKLRGREFRNKSIMGAIEKTWRKTIEGASKVFMEKQYNRHKRLINDIY